MIKPGEHSANFAIFSFRQHDFEYRRITTLINDFGTPRTHLAFRQPDAIGQLAHQLLTRFTGNRHSVCLFHTIFRMQKTLGQCSVVRQKHQPFAEAVQTSNDKKPFPCLRHKIQHQRTA
jgi:hypothetical protein